MANIERLQKLADHLLRGQLGHRVFSFDTYNAGEYNGNGCGTAGCAIGECPIVWPDQWVFYSDGIGTKPCMFPKLKTRTSCVTSISGQEFFNLPLEHYQALFIPRSQHYLGLPQLDAYVTKEQVANNILLFIQRQTT